MTFVSVAQASRRLGVDAKTLHRWLVEAQIPLHSSHQDGRKKGVIPSCVLRSHSEMGEIGHRTKKLLIVFKLTQLITKGISNGFKRGKSTSIKGFFPYFLANRLNGIQFTTIGRLWDQTNILWNNKIFGIIPSSLIALSHKKIFGKRFRNIF